MTSIEIGTSYHLSISKRHILNLLESNDDASEILSGWKGTREEAIEYVKNLDKDFLPWDTCDNHDDNGRCLGHKNN